MQGTGLFLYGKYEGYKKRVSFSSLCNPKTTIWASKREIFCYPNVCQITNDSISFMVEAKESIMLLISAQTRLGRTREKDCLALSYFWINWVIFYGDQPLSSTPLYQLLSLDLLRIYLSKHELAWASVGSIWKWLRAGYLFISTTISSTSAR